MRVGDVDNDNHLDIAWSDNGNGRLTVARGDGNGGFGPAERYPVFGQMRSVALGDLDGYLDMVGGNCCGGVAFLLNDGVASPGTFGAVQPFPGEGDVGNASRGPIEIADLDGNTRLDVVIGNQGPNISVFLNIPLAPSGIGFFRTQLISNVDSSANGVAVGDFDGDLILDLAANSLISGVHVFKGIGAGLFFSGVTYPAGSCPGFPFTLQVKAADFDGDGNLDLAATNGACDNVSVLRGDGLGSFSPPSDVPFPLDISVVNGPGALLTDDVNGDGKVDLLTVAGQSRTVAVLLNTTGPSDTTPPTIVPTVTGTLGNNGWYVSDVDVTWTVTDPDSPVTTTGCDPQLVNTDTAGVTFTCDATSDGGSASESVTVMRDATAPVIASVTADPSTLWPPNHKMRAVSVAVDASDAGAPPVACSISSVGVNEGANNHEPDSVVTGALTVDLRAERDGKGSGRVYTTDVSCTDDAGNPAVGSVEVTVPHDQGKGKK